MSCDHVGGPELIAMAEEHLRGHSVPQSRWPGSKFRYTQNLDGSMWASVCVEIERRGDEWIVTRLDRNRETAPSSETGFRELKP
jgi:hypothetical protein